MKKQDKLAKLAKIKQDKMWSRAIQKASPPQEKPKSKVGAK